MEVFKIVLISRYRKTKLDGNKRWSVMEPNAIN